MYLILPKCNNKSVGTIRSQGNMNKNLAYIVGSFLGDGSVDKSNRTFTLQTIDRDFAEKVAQDLKELSLNKVVCKMVKRLTSANRPVYSASVSDAVFCRKLQEITHNRKNLPIDFDKWDKVLQKELISGLLDSEGYVSITRDHVYNNLRVYDLKIGIGACDLWIYELHRFCQENGIKVGIITRETLKSNKIFAKFTFNKKSFIDNCLYFNINRKQKRIDGYKLLFPGSTTIRGISKTEETKKLMSDFSKTRQRIGGRFVKLDNDIV